MLLNKKKELRQKRIWRVRRKIAGTAERPRLCVSFTNKHIYAQAIDDDAGKTMLYLSTLAKDLREQKLAANKAGAQALGKLFGDRAKAAASTRSSSTAMAAATTAPSRCLPMQRALPAWSSSPIPTHLQ
jgi:large subunit ribosomal protein L18